MYLLSCLSVKVRNILGKLQYLLYPVINYYIVLLKLKIDQCHQIYMSKYAIIHKNLWTLFVFTIFFKIQNFRKRRIFKIV